MPTRQYMWRSKYDSKSDIALGLLLGSQLAMAQAEPYQEGVHYFKIDQVPADTGSGTVEVTELFSYACSHCNTFEPYLESWNQTKPDNVVFNRIAVAFGRKAWEMMARAYITAEMLGIADESHIAMMDAIWKERKQFRTVDELADFYSGFGVEKIGLSGKLSVICCGQSHCVKVSVMFSFLASRAHQAWLSIESTGSPATRTSGASMRCWTSWTSW